MNDEEAQPVMNAGVVTTDERRWLNAHEDDFGSCDDCDAPLAHVAPHLVLELVRVRRERDNAIRNGNRYRDEAARLEQKGEGFWQESRWARVELTAERARSAELRGALLRVRELREELGSLHPHHDDFGDKVESVHWRLGEALKSIPDSANPKGDNSEQSPSVVRASTPSSPADRRLQRATPQEP